MGEQISRVNIQNKLKKIIQDLKKIIQDLKKIIEFSFLL